MTRPTPGEQPYRLPQGLIAGVTRTLLWVVGVGVTTGLVVGLASDQWTGSPDWLGTAAGWFVVASLVVPVWVSAVLGGLAVHRHGWVPGLLLVPALAAPFGTPLARAWWGNTAATGWLVASLLLLVVVLLAFPVLGYLSGVPIWFEATPGAVTHVVSEGDATRRAHRDARDRDRDRRREARRRRRARP